MSAAALFSVAENLRRIRFSTSAYARGYRVGARAVLDTDPPPPGVGDTDRADYLTGLREGRYDRERES